jgi:FkbM family methyltransferase
VTENALELRQQFLRGDMDKHEYSRRMSARHAALTEHAALLAGTNVASIELTADGVILVSRQSGARFPCDPTDRGTPPVVSLDFGAYEAKDFAMLLALVPRRATFVDVGANIGWYSVHVALADPTARVLAMEPVPSSYRWLVAAVASNGLQNVTTLNVAAAAEPGELVLFVDAGISGAASSAPSTGPEGLDRVVCPAVTLDDVVARHGGIAHVLKLDIEGAELFALRGASAVLAAHRPIVFCEMLRKLARPFGYHPNDILGLMRGHGYDCYRAEEARLVAFESMNEETVETNFYFLHREAHRAERARWVDAV